MTYREAVAWLYGLQLHGIKLGLENMRRLCGELRIELAAGKGPAFIHVAGTNGKGSVCAMLDSICREAGLRTGLYTSPHLVTFRERIRLDGEMIPEEDVARGLERIRVITESWDHPPTFFEVTTALALEWFQAQGAEVVVLETGLGGRLDATNVVLPAISVLTPIGLDHQRYLGESVSAIAMEKCGIIKRGVPVVSALQLAEAEDAIQKSASENACELTFVTQPFSEEPVGLTGEHQRSNAALAAQTLSILRFTPPFDRITKVHLSAGLADVRWPGRFQRVGDRFILDGAHNPDSAAALVATWHQHFQQAKATVVIGVMRDKDVGQVCATLAPIAARFLPVAVGNSRSCTAAELGTLLRQQSPEVACEEHGSLPSALQGAEQYPERLLICGSLFLVGEALFALGLAEAPPESSSQ